MSAIRGWGTGQGNVREMSEHPVGPLRPTTGRTASSRCRMTARRGAGPRRGHGRTRDSPAGAALPLQAGNARFGSRAAAVLARRSDGAGPTAPLCRAAAVHDSPTLASGGGSPEDVSRRPIEPRIRTSEAEPPDGDAVSREDFREALSHWAAGVAVAAVRDGEEIQATTVSSLTSVSDSPPTVLISLTPSAKILPFVESGTLLGISILHEAQRRTASVFADGYPVGPSPFEDGPAPLVSGALVHLACTVTRIFPVAGSRIVVARVAATATGAADRPLLYYRRAFRTLS